MVPSLRLSLRVLARTSPSLVSTAAKSSGLTLSNALPSITVLSLSSSAVSGPTLHVATDFRA